MIGDPSSGGKSGDIGGCGDGGASDGKVSETARMISGTLEDWGLSILRLRYDLSVAIMTRLISAARLSMAASRSNLA
jgi:hypothetical protein